jgi:antitoxin MazE
MKAQIIQIGNSQGIRIPKVLLEETGISGEVELESSSDGILIRNIKKPRGDWDAIFKKLSDIDDDQAIDSQPAADFEKKEWQW